MLSRLLFIGVLPSFILGSPLPGVDAPSLLPRAEAPVASCAAIGSGIAYTICTPTVVTNASLVKGNNTWGGIFILDNAPNQAASSNRYIVVYEDTNEDVYRADVEVSVYGGRGVVLSIQNGESFS